MTVYNKPFTPTQHEALRKELINLGIVRDGRVVMETPAAGAAARTQ